MTQTLPPPHSRRPPEDWTAARADYEAGCSMRIVAERHGLNIRTVSRHARAENWRSPRIEAAEAWAMASGRSDYDPSAFSESIAAGHMADRDEEALLLRPDSVGLCRFAFRRAAECAAVSGPTEALAWIRLADAAARLRSRLDVDVRPMSEADYRRVAILAREETSACLDAIRDAPPEVIDPQVSEVSESVP